MEARSKQCTSRIVMSCGPRCCWRPKGLASKREKPIRINGMTGAGEGRHSRSTHKLLYVCGAASRTATSCWNVAPLTPAPATTSSSATHRADLAAVLVSLNLLASASRPVFDQPDELWRPGQVEGRVTRPVLRQSRGGPSPRHQATRDPRDVRGIGRSTAAGRGELPPSPRTRFRKPTAAPCAMRGRSRYFSRFPASSIRLRSACLPTSTTALTKPISFINCMLTWSAARSGIMLGSR